MYEKWLVIKRDEYKLPQLVAVDDSDPDYIKWRWFGNFSYTTPEAEKKSKIIETYTIALEAEADYDSAVDLLITGFYIKYCPEPETAVASAGWLSPSGQFFTCSAAGHEGLADWLIAKYYASNGSGRFLEERNWLKISSGGEFIVRHGNRLTKKQLDFLGTMTTLKNDPLFANTLNSDLRMYLDFLE